MRPMKNPHLSEEINADAGARTGEFGPQGKEQAFDVLPADRIAHRPCEYRLKRISVLFLHNQ